MSKNKQYTIVENPFRWQIQKQYQKLVEAINKISSEKLNEIASFIKSELSRLESAGIFTRPHEDLQYLIKEEMKRFIDDEIASKDSYYKDLERRADFESEQNLEAERAKEDFLDSYDGSDRAFMEQYQYGDDDSEDNSSEGNNSDAEEDDSSEDNNSDDEEDTSSESEYEAWKEDTLLNFGDLEDTQNLLDQFFDAPGGYSWFVHELLMNTLSFGEDLIEEMGFPKGGVTKEEVELVFAAIDLYIDWEKHNDIKRTDYIKNCLISAIDLFIKEERGDHDFAMSRLMEPLLFYDEEGLDPDFHNIESRYNKAYQAGDLITAQKIWSIYTKYRKYLNSKGIDDDGASVISYSESVNSVASIAKYDISERLKVALERADKYYEMRLYPHPDTKKLIYKDPISKHESSFDLANLMGRLADVGHKLEQYRPSPGKQNIFVPAFVFVVSANGGRKFITIELDLEYEIRLLSKKASDGVLRSDQDLKEIARNDITVGYEIFSTKAVGEEAAKKATEGAFADSEINHSERVFVQAMRNSENSKKIAEILREKVQKEFAGVKEASVDGVAIVGYSTNTVCNNCSPTLIYLQNSIKKDEPVDLLVKALNKVVAGKVKLSTLGFDQKTHTQDFSKFAVQTVVSGHVNFATQAHDLTDTHLHNGISKPTQFHNPKAKLVLENDGILMNMPNEKLPYTLAQPYIVEFSGLNHGFTPIGDHFAGVCFTSGGDSWAGKVPFGILTAAPTPVQDMVGPSGTTASFRVGFIHQVIYDNGFLRSGIGSSLLEQATDQYGSIGTNLLLSLGCEHFDEIVEAIHKQGVREVFDTLFVGLEKIQESNSLEIIKAYTKSVSFYSSVGLNSFNRLWNFQKFGVAGFFFSEEISALEEIATKHGIVVEDITSASMFRELLLKTHPDKGGIQDDFVRVNEYRSLLSNNEELTKRAYSLSNDIHNVVHSAAVGIKAFDLGVDFMRLYHSPNLNSIKDVGNDVLQLGNLYYGLGPVSMLIRGLEVSYNLYKGDYREALNGAISTVSVAAITTAISANPIGGLALSIGFTCGSAYYAVDNAYKFYQELYQVENELSGVEQMGLLV